MASPMPPVSPTAVEAANRAIGLVENVSRAPTTTELVLAEAGVSGINDVKRGRIIIVGGAAAAGLLLGYLFGRR